MRLLAVAALVVAALSCEESLPRVGNPSNCKQNRALCPAQGLVCDSVTEHCIPPSAACSTQVDCNAVTSAVCQEAGCAPCGQDSDCQTWSMVQSKTPALPYCVSGVCQACRSSTDCSVATPVCDTTTATCRTCQSDNECSSYVCRQAGDHPESPPIPGLQPGQCVPLNQVVYVNKDASSTNNCAPTPQDSTPARPCCSLQMAMTVSKPYIRILGGTPLYSALVVDPPGGNWTLVGTGRDANPPVRLSRVVLPAGSLTLRDLHVEWSGSNAAVSCSGGAKLYLQRVRISNTDAPGRGVDADCAEVYLDASHVRAALHGVAIGSSGLPITYRIVNSAVVQSGNNPMNELYGVLLGPRAAGVFAYNTITRNLSGVRCENNQLLTDSIVSGNSNPAGPSIAVSQCSVMRVYNGQTQVLELTPDPKLLSTSNCCADLGAQPTGFTLNKDFFGRPRPLGGGLDWGYHELR